MKVRFYADVPIMAGPGYSICAMTNPGIFSAMPNWKRIAFDVDFPPDVLRDADAKAPATFAPVIEQEAKT